MGAYLEELSSETEASLENARKAAQAYNATLISGTADAFTKDAIASASLDYAEGSSVFQCRTELQKTAPAKGEFISAPS